MDLNFKGWGPENWKCVRCEIKFDAPLKAKRATRKMGAHFIKVGFLSINVPSRKGLITIGKATSVAALIINPNIDIRKTNKYGFRYASKRRYRF